MALEPGGYADKLGNRYEGRWVVRQLLRVLSEDIRAVTFESVGDEERGVDLWVEHADGGRQAQQCKIRNGSYDRWSVADLARRSILAAMREHLDRKASNEFALITAVPSTLLHDVCESARQSAGNPEEFYEHQIQSIGEDRRQAFAQFCTHLSLDPGNPTDRAAAYSLLRRMFIELWPDTRTSRNDLLDQVQTLVGGDPSTTIAVLADFALDNLRVRLDAPRIWRHLKERGLHPRQLNHDTRVAPAFKSLQRQFFESIEGDLIRGALIPRSETDAILEALTHSTLVAVHGGPGRGKSGVLYDLAQRCAVGEQLCLAVRLDRQEPRDTPRQFGLDIGLPESPVRCLAELAGDRPSVLILDQLDAIRWTSRHSLNALEVCKSLVREVRSLRSLGARIGVVVACRTYDMQNDPEIKNWLAGEKKARDGSVVEIGIEPLSDEVVASVANESGQDAGALSSRQREILRSPQHLAMWVKIVTAQGGFEFQNRVQLMREFWSARLREIAERGVPESDARAVLAELVDYMEHNSRVAAPQTLVSNVVATNALCASGLLRTADGQITFAHQSYLDHEIACRVVRAIYATGQDIVEWLGPQSRQSLFRREQLRQALCLLSEEAPEQFVSTTRAILGSDDVRFHLKHLCLEMIGQMELPSADLIATLIELADTSEWREQILGTVFIGHPPFIRCLMQDGTLGAWLQSDERRREALWLLRTVADKVPDEVTEALSPYATLSEEWRAQALECLAWNAEDDSESMFELRLNLARSGVFRDFVNWKELPAPRILHLLDAVLASWRPDDFRERFGPTAGRRSRIEHWSEEDVSALLDAVRAAPGEAWQMVIGHILRLAPSEGADDGESAVELWLDSDIHGVRHSMEGIPHGLVRSAIEAGRLLATADGHAFWTDTEALRVSGSSVIRFLLIEAYTTLPGSLADVALSWLIDDPARLRAGSGSYEPEWQPAARLIGALSADCSGAVFERVECAIIGYHDPNERRAAEYWLTTWKRGFFGDYWGRAQHFLLSALCNARRSSEADALIGVLRRKFEKYSPERFTRGMPTRGGYLGSTLPDDLLRLSDEAWLGIVSNEDITEDGDHRWRQVGADHIKESSIWQFSRNLQGVAKRFPDRFGRLALRFPGGTHPNYRAAILEGLKATKPTEGPEEEKREWRPASVELVEEVMTQLDDDTSREYALSFCWLMHKRAAESWSSTSIERLIRFALAHADPESDQLVVGNASSNFSAAEASVGDLLTNALNTVRSVATLAIGQQLRHHPELLERFRGPIAQLCADASPVVRTATVEACLPILSVDKDFAMTCFFQASADDLRMAASRAGVYFFNCGIASHHAELSALITRMNESERGDVSEEGAEEVAARWLFNDYFENEVANCLRGRLSQRKGVAQTAALFVIRTEYFEKCRRLLDCLMNDPESDVRHAINAIARSPELLQQTPGIELILRFVESRSFHDDPTSLIFGLKMYSGTLLPLADVLLAMCDQFVGPLRDASRDASRGVRWDMSHFLPIMIRLYEQADESHETEIVQRCLDAWDAMFRHRVGIVRELADAIA
jgi:hypothetical protein